MTGLARAAALSLGLGLFATPSFADDCAPLKILASLDATPLGPGGRMTVPVSINGTTKHLLLDTAGGLSTMSSGAVESLGLHALDTSRVRLLSGSGNASHRYVHIDNFQIGNMHGSLDMMVSPDPNLGQNGQIDGILAGDLMSHYDVEIDPAAHKFNYFSPDHCEGKVVYWPATIVAVVPIKLGQPMRSGVPGERAVGSNPFDTHIRVPIMLDGKKFDAVIATSSPNSTISAETAKRVFDITADSPGSVALGTAGNQKVFGHVFASLSFAGVTVSDPHLVVRPNLIGARDPDNGLMTGSNLERVDDGLGSEVTIGMDVLKNLHLYIAYKERNLYITPAAPPAATAPQP